MNIKLEECRKDIENIKGEVVKKLEELFHINIREGCMRRESYIELVFVDNIIARGRIIVEGWEGFGLRMCFIF